MLNRARGLFCRMRRLQPSCKRLVKNSIGILAIGLVNVVIERSIDRLTSVGDELLRTTRYALRELDPHLSDGRCSQVTLNWVPSEARVRPESGQKRAVGAHNLDCNAREPELHYFSMKVSAIKEM
jgi:hypothetical protein